MKTAIILLMCASFLCSCVDNKNETKNCDVEQQFEAQRIQEAKNRGAEGFESPKLF